MSADRRVLLTVRNVPKLRAEDGGRTIYRDRSLTGFYLAVYPPSQRFPQGVRSYGVWYRVAGRARDVRLGRHPAVGLASARDQARRIVEAARVRRVDLGSAPAVLTLTELVEAFIRAARKQNPRTRSDSTLRNYEQMLGADVRKTRAGRMPIEDLRRADLRELIRAKAARAPGVATNLRRLLVASGRWGLREEVLERDPMGGLEQLDGGESSRERVLRDEEIVILWRACAEEAVAKKSAAIERGRGRAGAKWTRERTEDERAAAAQRAVLARLLLLTAQRSGETSMLEWPELDAEMRLWHIPAAHRKGQRGKQRAHVVPVSAAARAELQAWRADSRSGWDPRALAWAAANHRHWVDPLRDRARGLGLVEHWTPHDLRRTAATGMARLGATRTIIAMVLGHTIQEGGAVTGIYERFDRMPERTAALEAWGAHVAALVRRTPKG